MDKKRLVETCEQLKMVSEKSVDEFIKNSDQIISEMNIEMLKRADIDSLVGTENLEMMEDNHSNHIRFLTSILKEFNAEVFVETIIWVFRAYRSRGFSTNYWAAQLNTWTKILKNQLSEETYLEIIPYYEWMLINIPVFVKLSDEKLETPNN